MFLVSIFGWWYGDGWKSHIGSIRERLEISTDFFSLKQLAKTLFAPYRQISAGRVSGSLDVMIRAFADRTISRLIGGIVRLSLLVLGLVAILVQLLFGALMFLIWPILPLLPIAGMILFVIGWVPWIS